MWKSLLKVLKSPVVPQCLRNVSGSLLSNVSTWEATEKDVMPGVHDVK